jgi:hypothetical protein
MRTNLLKKSKRLRQQAGIALITTLMLMFLMSSLLVGFTILLISNQQLAGSNNDDVDAFYGAEAGMEQLTAGLGNLFTQTYSPTIGQIDALETTPPTIPGVSFVTGSGSSGYQITPQSLDSYGNPAPIISTIKAGPYTGMTAMITDYNLTVTTRTPAGREVKLLRTTETVGIPMFQFAIFCAVDCSFHAGSNFTVQGRVHGNGNLFLASGATLQMQGKVDAYKDIIREYMDNGASTSANWGGTVSITTNPGGSSYRSLGLTEGSVLASNTACNTGWGKISTGPSPTDYGSNLINGQGSPNCASYSTGADLLNLGIVTIGGGTTQPIDLIRRPYASESSNVTGERYMAQSSLAILISDNPTDIMSLPCVEQGTQPLDLSALAQPVANWPTTGAYQTLETNMTTYGTTPLPLAASGGGGAYSATDGYWLPSGYPIVKGYIKIQAQIAYGSPCGTWKDVTTEVLALGYAGRNINPVSQSITTNKVNTQWPAYGLAGCTSQTSCTQMDPLSSGSTHYYSTSLATATPPNAMTVNTGYTYPMPNPASAQLPSQSNASMAAGTFTTQTGTCLDPHPNAIIRLERIRDNPSSLYAAHYKPATTWINYVGSGTLSGTNEPVEAPVAVVCGVDPATGKLPIIADTAGNTAVWTPQPWDFWNNTVFDAREGGLRDGSVPNANLPTLNGTMHYVELDVANLVKWFAGTIGTSGTLTKDPVVAPNDFSVYFSDRRGNYVATQTWTGTWPPLSPTGHETGEYGWNDIVNSVSDPTNGCPNNSLDTGEDLDSLSQLLTYGALSANTKYIMDQGATLASLYNISGSSITGTNTTTGGLNGNGAYGEYGYYATLTPAAISANPSCATPTYATAAPGIWPMMYATATTAARENPPLFFRRALKAMDAKNLTGLGTCPGGTPCGLAIAAENPVYVMGDFNANSAGNGFSDPDVGTSIAADAVTILSNNWNDANSFAFTLYANNGPRLPATSYWRMAVIGGKGVSFPQFGSSADNGTDGGMHNFLRYLENWGGGSFTVNYEGALVNLFTNRQDSGIFKYGNTVYTVPTRVATFDNNFLTPALLPPRTPLFRDIDTTGWTRLQLASQ